MNFTNINTDAWSSGQIGSKIWLINEAQRNLPNLDWQFFLLGGWYGILAFMLKMKSNLNIRRIVNFDINPNVCEISMRINDFWRWKEEFISHDADINIISYEYYFDSRYENLFINTSTEHMSNKNWWSNIPDSSWVILQSTNMKHEEHLDLVNSSDELSEKFPMKTLKYRGELFFNYHNNNNFFRYMLIGKK